MATTETVFHAAWRYLSRPAMLVAVCCLVAFTFDRGHHLATLSLFVVANTPMLRSWLRLSRLWMSIDDEGVRLVDEGCFTEVLWTARPSLTFTERLDRPNELEYSLVVRNKVVLKFDSDLADCAEAVRLIEEQIAQNEYAQLRSAIDRGHLVSFGRIRLSRDRMWIGSSSFELTDFRFVHQGGRLAIRRRHPDHECLSLRTMHVRNLSLLLHMSEELRTEAENETTERCIVA